MTIHLFTLPNSQSIHYLHSKLPMNQQSFSRIQYESIPRTTDDTIICIANSLWIHYFLRGFTLSSLFIAQSDNDSTINLPNSIWIPYIFANPLWIPYLFRPWTMDPLYFCGLTMNSLSFSRIHHKFLIYSANNWWFHYLRHEFTMNLLFFREFTIYPTIYPLK